MKIHNSLFIFTILISPLITLLSLIKSSPFIHKTSAKAAKSISTPRILQNAYTTELTSEAIFDLTNLHDNLFAIKVKVGSPAQTLNLIVDISSEFSFLKVPKCLDTSCDENFEKNENIFNYDPNASNSKKLVQKDSTFFYNNVKYEADILKDIFSFPVSADFEVPDESGLFGDYLVLDDFSFFLVDEHISLDADGVLGLNPFVASGKYNQFSFIESASNKGIISEKTFAFKYLDKYHAKLFLGKNNFEKHMQLMLSSQINSGNSYNNNENTIRGNTNTNNNNNKFYNSIYDNNNNYIPNTNKNSDNYSKESNNQDAYNYLNPYASGARKNTNYSISSCKINPVKSNQSLAHFLANNKQVPASSRKSLIDPLHSWNCRASHLLLGEENNFYSAVPLEEAIEAKSDTTKGEISLSIPSSAVNVEFSTCIKNLVVNIRYLNLFFEKYAKKITPFCVVKNENKVSYINCEKKHLDSSVIPSLNFIFNGFSYKILARDLFETIYGDSDNLYYRLRIAFTETPENKWFFGYIFLKNNLIEFNKQKNSIIFYEGNKFDLSKFISDTKETFCLYNFFNYVFVILLISLCMFYIYNREKKKNQIIEIPFFLKKNYSEITSEKDSGSVSDKTKKDSLISKKNSYLLIERESETPNLNINNNNLIKESSSAGSIAAEKFTKENEKNKKANELKDLSVINKHKNDRLLEVKEFGEDTYSESYFGGSKNKIEEKEKAKGDLFSFGKSG